MVHLLFVVANPVCLRWMGRPGSEAGSRRERRMRGLRSRPGRRTAAQHWCLRQAV